MMDMVKHYVRHFMHVTYHSLHQFGVPSTAVPDTFLVLIALILAVWLAFVGLVGRQSARKGQSFWYGFLFALLTTPLVASVFIAFLRPLKTVRKTSRKRLSFAADSRGRERVA